MRVYSDQAEKLRRLVRAGRNAARVIAVTSGKGGVGKTNLAVNLAVCLSGQGHRVVLIDADLGLANADVLLDMHSRYNLWHVISGQRELEQIITEAPGGIGLISGASGVSRLANLSEFERYQLVRRLDGLEAIADILLLDCAAGVGRNVLAFATAADHVLVVTTPEPPALTDAYATAKMLVREGFEGPISVVANMVSSRNDAAEAHDRLARVAEQFLQVRLESGGYVLRDEHVPLAVRQRVPVVLRYPRCPASLCLMGVAWQVARQACWAGQRDGFFRRVVNFLF